MNSGSSPCAPRYFDAASPPLEALRRYLGAVNEAVQPATAEFARDFAGVPGADRLLDAHEGYVIAVTRSLLERAVAEGRIAPIDTAALAHVLGGLGREFSRPPVLAAIAATPKQTADLVTAILLRGLGTTAQTQRAQGRDGDG